MNVIVGVSPELALTGTVGKEAEGILKVEGLVEADGAVTVLERGAEKAEVGRVGFGQRVESEVE